MPDKRYVTVCHVGGSTKQVELVDLLPKKKHAAVYWPTAGLMWFNFSTGRALGAPSGPWRLSDEARKQLCAELGEKPKNYSRPPPKKKSVIQDVHDPRQLWLVEEGKS